MVRTIKPIQRSAVPVPGGGWCGDVCWGDVGDGGALVAVGECGRSRAPTPAPSNTAANTFNLELRHRANAHSLASQFFLLLRARCTAVSASSLCAAPPTAGIRAVLPLAAPNRRPRHWQARL